MIIPGAKLNQRLVDCQRPRISAFIIMTTCESDSFIQSSPTHLRDLNNTSWHNESNALTGEKKKKNTHTHPHKHTHDKRKFAYELLKASVANGCTAVAFWRPLWCLIMADVNNAVLIMEVMKSESVSHGFICKGEIIKTKGPVLSRQIRKTTKYDAWQSSRSDAGLSFVSWLVALWH